MQGIIMFIVVLAIGLIGFWGGYVIGRYDGFELGMDSAIEVYVEAYRESEATLERNIEPTHDLRTDTHACVKADPQTDCPWG